MSLRIIHTADVHLDAAFSESRLPGRKAGVKRDSIRDCFRRIIDDCFAWKADALVIAGDLFEAERLSPDTTGFLRTQFQRLADVPVLISPGNHDPFTRASAYDSVHWSPNVFIFPPGKPSSFEFESLSAVFHGLAHSSARMQGRLLDHVAAAPRSGRIEVLVAHASDETAIPSDKSENDFWLSFSRDEIASLGFDYVALGHYHGPYDIPDDSGSIAASYPGSPEGLRFSETGRRTYNRVTIDSDGVALERVPVSKIDYFSRDIACSGFQSREQFFDEASMSVSVRPGETIARFVATGRVQPGFNLSAELPDRLRERYFHVVVRDDTVPDYDWQEIESEESLRGEVARRFAEQLATAAPENVRLIEVARIYAIEALEGRAAELPAEVLRVD